MTAAEFNFDGLVGPTHNYAGLSVGNVASSRNQGLVSNPEEAAQQGIRKMLVLHQLGLPQAVLPPQERPCIGFLRRCGYTGTDSQVLEHAARHSPDLFCAACSASSMWTANAATVSPAADTRDGKLHLTPANLVNKLHRSIEAKSTQAILGAIFRDPEFFIIHDPLPGHASLGDEGAANHTRLCSGYGEPGLEIFVYGRAFFDQSSPAPSHYPARQTREASQAIIRAHDLKLGAAVLAQQNPAVIDQGVFHNDVIAVGNRNVLFYHQHAFLDESELRDRIGRFFGDREHYLLNVPDARVSVEDAVQTYLFNSQMVTLPGGEMALVLPGECEQNPRVRDYLDELRGEANPVRELVFMDLRQSMANGGGPACLRLRVVLTPEQTAAINPAVILDEKLAAKLDLWVQKHYRDRLESESLADPQLLDESRTALDELTTLLDLGSVYPFQN